HCVKCGEAVVAQQTVPATGHKEVLQEAVAPTCTEDGLSAGVHCSVCNTTLIAQEPVPAGHTFTDWKTVTEPDCFFPGEETRICKVCDLVENRDVEPIAHSFVQDEETKLFSCELCDARIYAGHLYAAFDVKLNWYDAYKMCDSLGGHLVTITSEGEQNFITEIINNKTLPTGYYYWAGGLKNTSGWEWITDEEMSYTHWGSQGLDDGIVAQWHIALTTKLVNTGNLKMNPGDWEDIEHHQKYGLICEWDLDIVESEHFFTEWETTTEANCFGDGEEYRICTHCGLEETEVLPQLEHNFVFNEATGVTSCEHCSAATYDGRIYKIFNVQLSWFDAYSYCESLGGHLVTITSQEEQTFIETYMNSLSFSNQAWIGAYSDGEKWQWITDEAFEYTNWNPGEPNCTQGYEFFGHINHNSLGQWNDYMPFNTSIIAFICEWEAE
ncbi:MAG: hypothetical protein IKV07_02300, partial [Bacteroidaceae bacterium]|nr:hypothetical protein [Bacteroidaceae bacterium]